MFLNVCLWIFAVYHYQTQRFWYPKQPHNWLCLFNYCLEISQNTCNMWQKPCQAVSGQLSKQSQCLAWGSKIVQGWSHCCSNSTQLQDRNSEKLYPKKKKKLLCWQRIVPKVFGFNNWFTKYWLMFSKLKRKALQTVFGQAIGDRWIGEKKKHKNKKHWV